MDDVEVGRNVCNFIDYGNGRGRSHGRFQYDEDHSDLDLLHGCYNTADARLRALEHRVFGIPPHGTPWPGANPRSKGPGPAGCGTRKGTSMQPLQDSSITNVENHRGAPQDPHDPRNVYSGDRLLQLDEHVRSGSAPLTRPLSPVPPPVDVPAVAKDPESTPVHQDPLPRQIYTPSTSSAGRRGRGAQQADFWDDLSSGSDLSDDDIVRSLARTESPPRYKADKFSADPRDEPVRGQPSLEQLKAFEDWKWHVAAVNSRSATHPELVRRPDGHFWLGAEGKKAPKQERYTRTSVLMDDMWDSEKRVDKPASGKDHQHCGNCGQARDESGHRL